MNNELNETQNTLEPAENQSASSTQPVKPQNKRYFGNIEKNIYLFFAVFGIMFLSIILAFQIILTPIKVVGTSMQPTINLYVENEFDEDHSDIVYYQKQNTYNTNDIVIIKNNQYVNSSNYKIDYLIKRVIALPGQTIKFKKTSESTTTTIFYEIEVFDKSGTSIGYSDSLKKEKMKYTKNEIVNASVEFTVFKQIFTPLLISNESTYTVPENKYFVMGDNRNYSEDSRFFGAVDTADICGSVKLFVPYGQNLWQAIWFKIKNA